MTYVPTAWVDYGVPCIEAATLNNAEDGIDRAQGDVMVLYDTTANIPVTDPLLIGRLYFETDLLRRVWRDNGAGWDLLATPGDPAPLLETGQTTAYSVFDDGDYEIGVDKAYTVQAAGAYAGNSNIEVAHYAGNQISFTLAGSVVADVAAGLVTFLAGDIVVIKGSALNDGVYTVAVGGVAGQFTTVQPLINEGAGLYVSIYKRAAHSNNAVDDDNTGLMWSRNTSTGEDVGAASNGTLNWYNVATRYTIYAGANTVSLIMPGNIIRVIGGAALTQFHVGDMIMVAGFANAVNLLPHLYVVSVTINGADLDIVVDPGNQVLIAEGAVGDTIYLNCRSIYNYAAGARLGSLSGQTDWRVPNFTELLSLMDMEAPTRFPDAVAFPVWPNIVWNSSTRPDATTAALYIRFDNNVALGLFAAKTTATLCALTRG